MKRLEITRTEKHSDCIRGVIKLDGEIIAYSLELPYLDNQPNISAIPAGTYKAEKHTSDKFGKVFILKDVPNRSAILIHSGNIADETQGCILPGLAHGKYKGKTAVLASKAAMDILREQLGDEQFEVVITEAYHDI